MRWKSTLFATILLFGPTLRASEPKAPDCLQPLTPAYSVQFIDATEEVEGTSVQFQKIGDDAPSRLARTDQVSRRGLQIDPFWELFEKGVKPGMLDRWQARRFNLSRIIAGDGAELLLGYDINHAYLMFKESGADHEWTRADYLVAKNEFLVRRGKDEVAEGIFFRFSEMADEDLQKLSEFFRERKPYLTCTQATCTALAQIGIHVGAGPEAPTATEAMLRRFLAEGFRFEGGVPDGVEVLSLSAEPLKKQIDRALKVSGMLRQLRNHELYAYLALFHYGAKTLLRWLALRPIDPPLPLAPPNPVNSRPESPQTPRE